MTMSLILSVRSFVRVNFFDFSRFLALLNFYLVGALRSNTVPATLATAPVGINLSVTGVKQFAAILIICSFRPNGVFFLVTKEK